MGLISSSIYFNEICILAKCDDQNTKFKYSTMFSKILLFHLEQDVSPPLAGVLDIDPHLPVLLASLVVISVVLSPGKQTAHAKVEEHWTQQQTKIMNVSN